MKVILYGAHGCPMCSALGMMLKKHHIDFEKNEDIESMIARGFDSIPMLELPDGKLLKYGEAIQYIKSLG